MQNLQRLRRMLLSVFVVVGCSLGAAQAETIAVDTRRIPLDPSQPERTTLGALTYRGGLQLSSRDPRFGGTSGLQVSADGKRFVAITDVGFWMTGTLRYDADGNLVGVEDVELEPLRDAAGKPFTEKYYSDAESITTAPDGGYIVGFEGQQRLLQYARVGGPGVRINAPPGLRKGPRNGGLEALTTLADGRLLAITEDWKVDGGVHAWTGPAPWQAFVWPTSEGFEPTEAALLPDGDVLVLERRFPPLAARIRRVEAAQLRPGSLPKPTEIARFEGSVNYDNMEAMAVRRAANGDVLVYVASDDNQNFLQRSLLMQFAIPKD